MLVTEMELGKCPPVTSVEKRDHSKTCRGMLKQTISPESRTPVTCVEKFSGQEIR